MAVIVLFIQSIGTLQGGAKTQTVGSAPPPPPPPPGFALSGSCPAGQVNSPYSCALSAVGGTPPYTFSEVTRQVRPRVAIRMPPGLTLASNGVISGVPTQVGTTLITVQVTDARPQSVTGTVSIVIFTLSRTAIKPQQWANPHEADLPNPCDAAHNCYIKHIRGPNGPAGDYPCSLAGLNSSMNDWAATAPNVWWWVKIDDKLSTGGQCHITNSGTTGWLWKAKSTGFPTAFIVYESEHPNATGRTVCNHVVALSLIADMRNANCNTVPGIDDLDHMWKFTSTSGGGYGGQMINNYNQVDSQGNGPSHIVVRDAEMEALGNNSTPINLFTCNRNAGVSTCPVNPPTAMSFGSHVGLERNYMHGDWILPATGKIQSPAGGNQVEFIYSACTLCWIEWNYFDRVSRGPGNEGKVISLTNGGPGTKIAHNWVEGAEINFLSGGGSGTFRNTPSTDVEVRANVWTADPLWMTSASLGNANIPVNYNDCRWSKKNAFELKEGNRYLVNGNIFERSLGCNQQGQGPTITVRACSGSDCNNFTAEISDLTFTNNVIRDMQNAIQGSARSVGAGSGGMVARPGRRWNIVNNLGYNFRTTTVGGNPQNVYTSGGDIYINWRLCDGQRDGAGATVTITCAESNNPPWNSRTLMIEGDPVVTRGCTPSTFNTPTGVGPPALAGTNGLEPNGRTVVYANAGPPNEPVTGCIVHATQGAPFESTYTHNTMLWGSGGSMAWPIILGNAATNCTYVRGAVYQDDIISGFPTASWTFMRAGGCGSEGNAAAQNLAFDTSTLIFNHLLFTGNKVSTVVAYPSSQAGTLWSPPQAGVICPDATATTTCIGYNGYMNGTTFVNDPVASYGQDPLVFYALHPSSMYKAGNARQASDGTDMGADMNKIRQAFTEMQYSGCAPGECGTGPNPD